MSQTQNTNATAQFPIMGLLQDRVYYLFWVILPIFDTPS